MAEVRTNRRLAAILAADVVGYSRLMAADEAGTLAALKRHREAVFDPAVLQHNGRIVKLIGDGTLVEFGSVVDAINCALSVQRTAAMPAAAPDPRIVLRIGVNLGDVIIDGDDLYGDGVNVAARLEPLAEPGGICVASIVNESVGNRIDASFEDGGEVQVKNIDRPIHIWKWSPGDIAVLATKPSAVSRPMVDKPSIAVLPFANMSGDAEQEYFSDGITEDIITDLSKVAGLLVIARNSSFAYKGKQVDMRTIANDLRVRSVLEGSIRRAGNRVRITAQLIDASTGGHLWAERYDRDLTDIFAVQDEVTRQIVAALKVALSPTEKVLVTGGGTTRVDAHDLFLKARKLLVAPAKNRRIFEEVVGLLSRAIELDPNYAAAYALVTSAYMLNFHNRWTEDRDRSLSMAGQFADQALEKDRNEPFAHFAVAVVATERGELERAKVAAEAALALSPNFALALMAHGFINTYMGDPLSAIADLERALRLDPGIGHQHLHFLGVAYLVAGKYETAAAIFRERILLVPDTDLTRPYYVSALGHLGRFNEARQVWQELKEINPRYSLSEHIGRLPFKNQADVDRITEGLTKAGLSG
jgi:adenylate cyclase